MAEEFSQAWGEEVEIDVLDRHAEGSVAVLATAPLSVAHVNPVGGLVAGALEALGIDKGFDQIDGVAISSLPVGAHTLEGEGQ